MTAALESAVAKLKARADALGLALTLEQSLEDDRAAIKADAIKRVMVRDGIAATPAEKIVETDAYYFEHRDKQRDSIISRIRADAEYWAAKCEATQASRITPDVFVLDAENAELERHIGEVIEANKSLLHSRNGTREANAELVAANRELAEQLAVANEMLGQSRISVVEVIP